MLYDENRRVMRALEVGAETIKHAPAQPLRRLREAELQVVVLPADCAGRQARRDHVEHSWRGATGGDVHPAGLPSTVHANTAVQRHQAQK